jgi:para-aminobenzoate synthetase component 1
MPLNEFIQTINQWGRHQIPFLFLIDFEMKNPLALRLTDIDPDKLIYDFNGATNDAHPPVPPTNIDFVIHPVSLTEFQKKFNTVSHHLAFGDSYLTNLTVRSEIKTSCSLRELFRISKAKYKLLVQDEFLVFSPEIFVQIRNGKIYSYPMKGTIDASVPDAAEKILKDQKELAEHVTIVDLIRNDLSQISHQVKVNRFRYLDELHTNGKKLLQVSSEIAGELPDGYRSQLGNIITALLPAGSVSGAPKKKTLQIIRQAEGSSRGYYTGVAGIFDGNTLDSGVMIRFIEKDEKKLFYRSGGGITTQSVMELEYQEVIDKVYVPFY